MNELDSGVSIQNGNNAADVNHGFHPVGNSFDFSSREDKISNASVADAELPRATETMISLDLKSALDESKATKIAHLESKKTYEDPVSCEATNDDDEHDVSVPLETISAPASQYPTQEDNGGTHFATPEKDNASSESAAAVAEKQEMSRKIDLTVDDRNVKSRPKISRGRSNSISLANVIEGGKSSDSKQTTSSSTVCGSEGRKKVKRSKKKATQRMRPKSHSPLRTEAAASSGQPLMDLRQILKKHEKKTDTQLMYEKESISRVDFYGSLSSIPFLHPDKEIDKKTRKGKRSKTKKEGSSLTSKKSVAKDVESKCGKEKNVDAISAMEITTPKDHNEDDVELWKTMSIQDGSFMEEVSHRPNEILPLRKIPSPTKKAKPIPPIQHNERGYGRPEDWVEFGHKLKRSSNVASFRHKKAPPSNHTAILSNPDAHDSHVKKERRKDEEPIVTAKEDRDLSRNPNSEPTKESKRLTSMMSEQATSSVTTLSIVFYDGCIISGNFRVEERVERVVNDLQRDLLRSDIALPDIELFAKGHENDEDYILDPKSKLKDLGLVPSGKVCVRWKSPLAVTMSPGWYLKSPN